MERIILHWTGGGFKPSVGEKKAYHFLIDSEAKISCGKFSPEDNADCKDGIYAAHTGGGNTGSIGVALCGMLGFKNKNETGFYPITKVQIEAACELCARLCIQYKISVNEETVMTHYEFGRKHPNTSSAGKIDITYLPPYEWVEKQEVGGFLRTKIKWYFVKYLNTV